MFGLLHIPVAALQTPATWHWSSAAHVIGFAPRHAPAWQVSNCVQALLSLHMVPLAAFGLLHMPVIVSQVPATWHWSSAAQVTGVPPTHAPAWQASICVQALLSEQAVPLGALVSAGHVSTIPAHVSAVSQASTAARQTVPAGDLVSAGQVPVLPVHISTASQAPAAARQTVVEASN